jgi:uncharacterized repeat protein (TIGR03803 family)
MRIITLLACAILLANCSRMASPLPMTSTQSMQSNGAFAVKPAAAWLCGQPPSAERRSEIAPQVAEGYQSLYKFKAGSDGGYPYGALTSFGGNLYGTTDQGGASGYGTVFEMSTAGKERLSLRRPDSRQRQILWHDAGRRRVRLGHDLRRHGIGSRAHRLQF